MKLNVLWTVFVFSFAYVTAEKSEKIQKRKSQYLLESHAPIHFIAILFLRCGDFQRHQIHK